MFMNKELQEYNLKIAVQEEANKIVDLYIEVSFFYPILLQVIYFLIQNSAAASSLQWVQTSLVFKVILFCIFSCAMTYLKNKNTFIQMFESSESQHRNISVILSLSLILISLHLLFPVQSFTLSVSELLIGIAGAIAVGILFQGVLAYRLAKYGKIFALTVMTVFNGIFCSLYMPCFHVFLLGLLLGYIALEYSLGVSIFVHVLILIASAFIHTWIVDGSLLFTLSLIFLIAGIILFVLNLKKVKVYFHESACSVSVYRYFFTSIWIVISLFMALTYILLKLIVQ